MERNVMIIHGATSRPEEHWFPWLADQVRGAGYNALVPRFPTPERQEVLPWLSVLDSTLNPLGTSTTLVGHSLGSALMLRALERPGPQVEASVFVSGFAGAIGNEFFDSLNAPFFVKPFHWPAIRSRAGRVRLFAGSNDPFVPLAKGEELAERLDADLTVIPGGGHLIAQYGYTEFQELWGRAPPRLGQRVCSPPDSTSPGRRPMNENPCASGTRTDFGTGCARSGPRAVTNL